MNTRHLENWTRLADVKPIDVVTDLPKRLPSLAEGVEIFLNPDHKTFALCYEGNPSSETITHWMDDLIVPQLLASEGRFVLHCGAVASEAGAFGFMGPSGHGKSTMTASLHDSDFTLMSDDAIILNIESGSVIAERLYPSLRLFPDTISEMFPNIRSTAPVADYTEKRHVAVSPGPASAPLVALFRLADPSDEIHIARLTPVDACMALIANSFALDPTDTVEATHRFSKATEAARNIAVFDLHYPRDYGVLPDVHARILRTIGLNDAAKTLS